MLERELRELKAAGAVTTGQSPRWPRGSHQGGSQAPGAGKDRFYEVPPVPGLAVRLRRQLQRPSGLLEVWGGAAGRTARPTLVSGAAGQVMRRLGWPQPVIGRWWGVASMGAATTEAEVGASRLVAARASQARRTASTQPGQ